MPGDVLVGDEEGVVVIPAVLAGEVAEAGRDQELIEELVWKKVNAGESMKAIYPPDAHTRTEFEATREAGPSPKQETRASPPPRPRGTS
jgi:hypothetical protein